MPKKSLQGLARAISVLGVGYFGLTILVLSLLDSDYSPVAQAASDYGVGRFALEMNLGFFLGGMSLIAFAYLLSREAAEKRSRAATVLFLVAGAILMVDSYFTADIQGAPLTMHGLIHAFGGLGFFITAPLGTVLVSRRTGRLGLGLTLLGLLAGFALLAANVDAAGLAERLILLVVFTSVVYRSVKFN